MENHQSQPSSNHKRSLKLATPSSELPFEWFSFFRSGISEFRYNPSRFELDLKYRGSLQGYRYLEVPPDVVDKFRLSTKKMSFLATEIKPRYGFRKLTAAEIRGLDRGVQ
jgi:hypothetical protein